MLLLAASEGDDCTSPEVQKDATSIVLIARNATNATPNVTSCSQHHTPTQSIVR
jgi:hypothetical protein